ncbi:MAG: hypothetical protein KDK36_12855 [Leptospiraceae bacterium]|nr:hypothetical protein [Leptospiraceae bacterium]
MKINKNIINEEEIILDESTKEEILLKAKTRIQKRELTNEEIKAQIENKELKKNLENVKIGTVTEAFREQKKRFIKLLKASWFGTMVFVLLLPVALTFVHAWSIASMAERFGSEFQRSFILGLCFAGLFEALMIGQVLSFNHKGARFTMWSAMAVLGIVTSLEIYKRGFDALELGDILRFVGGMFLIPIIKSFIIDIREKAEGKGKRPFKMLPESSQIKIKKDIKFFKSELDKFNNSKDIIETTISKKTGEKKERKKKAYTINRPNFREYSNSEQITQDDLKRLLVQNQIFTTLLWKELPTKRKASKGLEGTEEVENKHKEFILSNGQKSYKDLFININHCIDIIGNIPVKEYINKFATYYSMIEPNLFLSLITKNEFIKDKNLSDLSELIKDKYLKK